jgi:hypothetical protein
MKKTILFYAVFGVFIGIFGATQVSAQKGLVWNGVWTVPSRYTPSTLTIKPLAAGKFKFKIEAMNGANMGEVSGVATIKGGKAYFDDRKSNKKKDEVYGCKLTFTNKGSLIDVNMNNECQFYAGSGVYFANYYYKGKPKVKEDNFVVLEVLPNMTLDRKFKALVGKKDYERFLNAFHQIYPEDDLDGLGTKVFSACVRGMCPYWAGIIMYDKQGNFWAVVLDDSISDKIFAYYYTNVAAWTDKLPKTIDKFVTEKRDLNTNFTLVYKNKK